MEDRRAKMKRLRGELRDAIGDDGMKAISRGMSQMRTHTIDDVIRERLAEMPNEARDLYIWLRRQPPGAQVEVDDGQSVTLFRKYETGWARESHAFDIRLPEIHIAGMSERWVVTKARFKSPDKSGSLMEKMGHSTFRKGVAFGFWGADGVCNPKSSHKTCSDVHRRDIHPPSLVHTT